MDITIDKTLNDETNSIKAIQSGTITATTEGTRTDIRNLYAINRVAYFQFSKPVFDLVLEQVPENLREELKSDEEFVVGKMNFWEKVYNK